MELPNCHAQPPRTCPAATTATDFPSLHFCVLLGASGDVPGWYRLLEVHGKAHFKQQRCLRSHSFPWCLTTHHPLGLSHGPCPSKSWLGLCL